MRGSGACLSADLCEVGGSANTQPHQCHSPADGFSACRCYLLPDRPGQCRQDGEQTTPLSTRARMGCTCNSIHASRNRTWVCRLHSVASAHPLQPVQVAQPGRRHALQSPLHVQHTR